MKSIMIVFKKEMKDMLRDKKTLITSILLPLLILPIIYGFMGSSMSKDIKDVETKLNLAVISEEQNELSDYLNTLDNINIVESENVDKDIDGGKIEAAVIIPKGFDGALKNENDMKVEVVYDRSSNKSMMTSSAIENILNGFSERIVAKRLQERNIDVKVLTPFALESRAITLPDNKTSGIGAMMLGMLLPMLLIMYSANSPFAAAVDLGAGEKERGTLEPLLTTQVNRTSLLWGKLFAITTMGMLSVAASLTGLAIALKRNPVIFGGDDGSMGMGMNSILLIGLLTVLLTMVFSAVELAISMYARSFKEAQTYLMPLTLIAIVAGFGSYAVNVKTVSNGLLFVPLYNVSICLKEIALGRINYTHFGITVGSLLVLVFVSIIFARSMFSKEKVIFRT